MAEAPVCGRCGNPHWRFVKCDDAPAFAAAERASADERARAVVVPHWKSDRGREFRTRLSTVKQSAPNVFWRNDDGPKAA